MKRSILSATILFVPFAVGGLELSTACPYYSVELRVQLDTSVPWSTSAFVPLIQPLIQPRAT